MADKSGNPRRSPRQRVDITHQIRESADLISEEKGARRQPSSERAQAVARPEFPGGIGVLDETGFDALRKIRAVSALRDLHPTVISRRLGVDESSLLRTLVVARRLISHGWCQRAVYTDEAGHTNCAEVQVPTRWSLMGALRAAGGGELVGEYAIRMVRQSSGIFDLGRWNDSPVRTKSQVLAVLDVAVEAAGGRPRRRGGWGVGAEAH